MSSAKTLFAGDIEEKLYDAVLKGDAISCERLLEEYPLILDRVSFFYPNKTPLLHIAILQGNIEIIHVLTENLQLVQQLDSQKSSPLHIAAAKGNTIIVQKLLLEAPEMCWRRDCHGMNPIHVAAMHGHNLVLQALIQRNPSPAREKVDRGQTVLHLCVKHGRHVKALEVLVESLPELICVKDDDGDTILHLAARCKKYEIIRYLVEKNIIEKSLRNSKGETTLDILEEFPPDETTSEIKDILRTWWWRGSPQSLDRFREIGMVISILIATMAFQALISPPSGVWQEDSSTHRAGAAIMAYTHPKIYKHFIRANTVAFTSSIIIIFLLTTRLSSIHILVTVAVMHAMWVSVASITVSYGASLLVISPNLETQSLASVIWTVVTVTVVIVGAFWVRRSYRVRKTFKKKDLFDSQMGIALDAVSSAK